MFIDHLIRIQFVFPLLECNLIRFGQPISTNIHKFIRFSTFTQQLCGQNNYKLKQYDKSPFTPQQKADIQTQQHYNLFDLLESFGNLGRHTTPIAAPISSFSRIVYVMLNSVCLHLHLLQCYRKRNKFTGKLTMSGGRPNKLNHNKNMCDRFAVAHMNAFSYACREN